MLKLRMCAASMVPMRNAESGMPSPPVPPRPHSVSNFPAEHTGVHAEEKGNLPVGVVARASRPCEPGQPPHARDARDTTGHRAALSLAASERTEPIVPDRGGRSDLRSNSASEDGRSGGGFYVRPSAPIRLRFFNGPLDPFGQADSQLQELPDS